jgi:type II secretory pathway component GspD/PulD (secretin)/beta-lactamase regulating signal transducer with metallopeptidase domain
MNSHIETLNRWGEQFLNFAWPMLWQSSVVIAVVFILDLALRRKVRASVRHALWLVVLVKLVLPPTLALPTGPSWWIHPAAPPPPVKAAPVSFTVTYGEQTMPDFPLPPATIVPPKPPALTTAASTLALSGIVSTGLLAWLLVRWWQIHRKVRRANDSGTLQPILADARRLAYSHPDIRLKLTEDTMSPAVCGLFRPVILLPRSLVERLSAEQLRAVLLHETIHLRRGDVWVNCAQALLQIVYWWHPLLWLANARIRRVREEAVDDAVMLALRDDADIYAPTLLEVAKFAFRRPLASLGLVGILESRSALRQRIERLVNFNAPKKAGLTVVSILGILAFSAVALPMGQAPEKNNLPPTSDTTISVHQIYVTADGRFRLEPGGTNNLDLAGVRSWLESIKKDSSDATMQIHADAAAPYQAIVPLVDLCKELGIERVQLRTESAGSPQISAMPADQTAFYNLSPATTNALESKRESAQLVRDGKLLYEMGRFDDAEAKLNAALTLNPTNQAAHYYLDLVRQARQSPKTQGPRVIYPALTGSGTNANSNGTNLEQRVFKVDPYTFAGELRGVLMLHTNQAAQADVAEMALTVFGRLGVNLTPSAPGRSLAYSLGKGLLYVRATPSELDTVERVIEAMNQTAPQIHSKTRFLEVPIAEVEQMLRAGTAVDTNTVEIIAADKMVSLMRRLESAGGVKTLAEPESVTSTGRQAQMRSTNSTVDLVPRLLMDGYTLNLQTIVSKPETRTALVNIWDGQTLALVLPGSDAKNRLVIFITSWIVDPAGNRVHLDDELRQMQEKAKSDIPPQHTFILSDPDSRGTIHALEQRTGVVSLAEPQPVTPAEQGTDRINRMFVPDRIDIPTTATNVTESGTLVQEGKLLYEMGQFEEAGAKLNQAMKLDPNAQGASYYLSLVRQAVYARAELNGTNSVADSRVQVPNAWTPKVGIGMPVPNPFITNNNVLTGSNREAIYRKLNSIRLESVSWGNGIPLSEIIRYLNAESKALDPDNKGINFIFNPNGAASPVGGASNMINPNTGLPETPAPGVAPEMVDPSNINVKLMMSDISLHEVLDAVVMVADRPVKYSVLDYGVVITPKPPGPEPPMPEMRVFKVDTNAFASGLRGVRNLQTNDVVTMAKSFFSNLGVDLSAPGRSVSINGRLGLLFVRATPSELATVERIIQTMNQVPPQIHIKARFIAVEQDNNAANGFDWYLGSFTNGPVGTNGRGALSPTTARTRISNTTVNAVAVPTNDRQLTNGLRNTAPAPATVTGILTDPNFRVILHALESRPRTKILAEPEAVTTSGRQTKMRATEDLTFLNGINPLALKPPGVLSNELFLTEQVECGPIFDVVPYVLADGYTINLTATASVTEFLGYDKPTNTVTVYIAGKKQTAPVPLPKFRTQNISAPVTLFDGQTLVLSGPVTTVVRPAKDKVPLLGDLPLVGGLFRSQSKTGIKTENQLMVFVTATIVDPAGNRAHADDNLPFNPTKIPPQPQTSSPSR